MGKNGSHLCLPDRIEPAAKTIENAGLAFKLGYPCLEIIDESLAVLHAETLRGKMRQRYTEHPW